MRMTDLSLHAHTHTHIQTSIIMTFEVNSWRQFTTSSGAHTCEVQVYHVDSFLSYLDHESMLNLSIASGSVWEYKCTRSRPWCRRREQAHKRALENPPLPPHPPVPLHPHDEDGVDNPMILD
jgi:hypothetical protein